MTSVINLHPDEVIRYLKDHPQFFNDYADQLTELPVPHPHGSHAISIAERQNLALRDKNRVLENKLRELIQFGEENDALGDKVHRFALGMIRSEGLATTLQSIYENLDDDFEIPHVAIRMWPAVEGSPLKEYSPTSSELRVYAENLHSPYCGPHALYETGGWFGDTDVTLKSFAIAPLRDGTTFGLLIFGSEDSQRFHPGMGTLYLRRIAELCSYALRRYAGQASPG